MPAPHVTLTAGDGLALTAAVLTHVRPSHP